jgi:hypothetical protein
MITPHPLIDPPPSLEVEEEEGHVPPGPHIIPTLLDSGILLLSDLRTRIKIKIRIWISIWKEVEVREDGRVRAS